MHGFSVILKRKRSQKFASPTDPWSQSWEFGAMRLRLIASLVGRRLRRSGRVLGLAAWLLTFGAAPSFSGSMSEVPNFGSNPGNLKMFKYLPDRISDPAPLVVVMHGCLQTARGYHDHSGWAKYADQGGFVLLYPEQQTGLGPVVLPSGLNHPARCFNFAELRDSQRDGG